MFLQSNNFLFKFRHWEWASCLVCLGLDSAQSSDLEKLLYEASLKSKIWWLTSQWCNRRRCWSYDASNAMKVIASGNIGNKSWTLLRNSQETKSRPDFYSVGLALEWGRASAQKPGPIIKLTISKIEPEDQILKNSPEPFWKIVKTLSLKRIKQNC